MRYKGDIGLYFSGCQVPVKKCGIFITQPTIKQILQFGEQKFLQSAQLLTHFEDIVKPAKVGNPQLANVGDFQILMTVMVQQKEISEDIKNFLEFICPGFKVELDSNAILFKLDDNSDKIKGMLTQYNVEDFSLVVEELFIIKSKNDEGFNPANAKAAEIAAKLQKARDRNKKKTGVSDENFSIFTMYASTLTVGLSLDIQSVLNMTPFQLYDIYQRYFEKVAYDVYQKVATTPMMDVSNMNQPNNWTDNIYSENRGIDDSPMMSIYA